MILSKTGIFVQIGSGICTNCRKKLKEMDTKNVVTEMDEATQQMCNLSMEEEEVTFKPASLPSPSHSTFSTLSDTPMSLCETFEVSSTTLTEDKSFAIDFTPKEKLNAFLASRDTSPIRRTLSTPWDEASGRTKRYYARKARQVVTVCLEEIAPEQSDMLLDTVNKPTFEEASLDISFIDALRECYYNASHWSIRRQILSIMADKVSYKVLLKWIPDLTRYRFNIARHYILLHGRGVATTPSKNTRMYVSKEKIEHFLTFITSSHIVQDLPFGEKILKLSSGEQLRIPKIVCTLIPEHIILQYQGYCRDTGFGPASRSTLSRILRVCSASTRKSLHGLDYFAATGAEAFDELELIVETIGDEYGKGLTWARETTEKLKQAKRYLKGDYKVHVSANNSMVADHCRMYALSYSNDPDYKEACSHEHNMHCDRCDLLHLVLDEILSSKG
ncbi:hypothetical protein QZH41_020358 [Actinostola sp. cb2023]|nr:hypothetical protein QZH41_020358 [Actinostola sp. cb2023]